MPDRDRSGLAYVAFVGILVLATEIAPVVTQERKSLHPDLSGRWQLNGERSENAQTQLDRITSSQASGHGPGRHLAGLFGGGQDAKMKEARDLFLYRPSRFVVTQDGERIVLTDSDGRVRVLTAHGRKETVDDREVQSKWDQRRLVSAIALGNAKITETYERVMNAPQLIVTTKMQTGGQEISVRRVYDAMSPR